MKSALLSFAVTVLVVVPGVGQMRSTISASPMHAPGTFNGVHGPGVVLRFGFGRHFRRDGFGTVLYPYGLYDGYYQDGYRDAPDQATPPVVVVRDAPAVQAPAPVQVAPAEPKLIEVPEPAAVPASIAKMPTAIFILADGRRLESQNYTITDSVLTVKESHRPVLQVPLNQLNVEATLTENHQRGLDIRLPENRSEIVIGF